MKTPEQEQIRLIELMKRQLFQKYLLYPEMNITPEQDQQRIFRGQGFMDAMEFVKDFFKITT